MNNDEKKNKDTTSHDGLAPYEKPRIKSGQAFEKVLMGSGCNFNYNIAFSCSEPEENC